MKADFVDNLIAIMMIGGVFALIRYLGYFIKKRINNGNNDENNNFSK